MQMCTPLPQWLIYSCFLSLRCVFSYPLALCFSIIHWVHSSGISPISLLQFYSWSFSFLLPSVFYFSSLSAAPWYFALPSYLFPVSRLSFPTMFILPLLSEVFHFWHVCSFSSVTLVSPPSTHAPTRLVRLLFLRTNQHPHHLLYNYASTCSRHYS